MGIIMRTMSVFRAAAAAVVVAAATSLATSAFASPFFPFGPPKRSGPGAKRARDRKFTAQHPVAHATG